MPKFRKRPVIVDAVQYNGANAIAIEAFAGGDAEFRGGEMLIVTREGVLRASVGDWIIKGTAGEFYPCKPDIFAAIYESVVE